MRAYALRGLAMIRRAAAALLRLARRLFAVIAELHYQHRRLQILRQSPDMQLSNADAAPDTYREFLARTSGLMVHEPSARARLAGRPVR